MGVSSMVLGILSLVFCWVPGIGIVLGIIAIANAKKDEEGMLPGMAVAGLVCGIVGLCVCTIISFMAACAGMMV